MCRKNFLEHERETRQNGFSCQKEKTKEKAGGHLLPTRAKIRRTAQKELSKCQLFYTKPSVDTKNIDRRLSGFFVFPWESLSASMTKTQGGRRRKKRSPTKNIFPGGGTKTPKATVKTSAYAARICNTATLISSRLALYFTAAARMVSA